MEEELQFYSPWQDTKVRKGALPHWEQPGATYFLTWRLADSIPHAKLEQWNEERETWLASRPEQLSLQQEHTYHELFSGKIDEWLDAGMGACILQNSCLREFVKSSLLHFDKDRYVIHCFVIMPNHVHALTSLSEHTNLAELLHSWKSFSAQSINKYRGEKGAVWQKEYFDRLVRDQKHFGNCVRYIRRNPEKARLKVSDYCLFQNELAESIE